MGLCCCPWAFSSCHEQGLLFIAVHQLLNCGGFSYCRAQALGMQVSVVEALRFSSCDSWDLELGAQ